MRRLVRLAAVALVGGLAGAGCGDDASAIPPIDLTVLVPADLRTISDLAITSAGVVMVGPGGANSFAPDSVTIAAGQSVTWNWVSGFHSVVSDDMPAAFTASPAQAAGQFTVTFANPGTFRYHCGVHGAMMSGAIVVQ